MDKKESRIIHGIIIALEILLVILVITCSGCKSKNKTETGAEEKSLTTQEDSKVSDYNVSILLDLSDRITETSQIERDTLLISYFTDWFYKTQKAQPRESLFQNGDRMKVFFYPQPNIAGINQYQDDLTINMSVDAKGKLKRKAIANNRDNLEKMKTTWLNALNKIYGSTISTQNWIGSDIFGFFEKNAKTQCINKDAKRNILVILTDGYLYHEDSWRQVAKNIYTGISPKSVSTQEKIASTNVDLSNLEVLFLEVNPKKDTDFNKIKDLLTNWCNEMGIKHVEVVKIDLPANTKAEIEEFLNYKK